MSSDRTYFFPPPADVYRLENVSAVLDKNMRGVYRMLNELAKSFCPVCQTWAKEDEIHIANTQESTCNKIVNVSVR